MDIDKFLELRPKLYHLTHKDNLESIKESNKIYSTDYIVKKSGITEPESFLKTRRVKLKKVNFNGSEIYIRDQIPLHPSMINKAMDGTCTPGEYIYLLNKKVFFWPTKDRLERHYNTYKDQNPVILILDTKEIYDLNKERVKFCRLNSGALRANFYHGGKPPPRGLNTFKSPEDYKSTPSTVAEFTVDEYCEIPEKFCTAKSPNGDYKKMRV